MTLRLLMTQSGHGTDFETPRRL